MASAEPRPRRPGGLTAIAILNICFAVLGLLLGGGISYTMFHDRHERERAAADFERAAERDIDPRDPSAEMSKAMMKDWAEDMRHVSPGPYKLMFAAGVTSSVLLLISAFGLLGQRRLTGLHVSVGAAIALIVCGATAMIGLPFIFWGVPMFGAVYAFVLLPMVLAVYRKRLIY